jgi:hypothetical protein
MSSVNPGLVNSLTLRNPFFFNMRNAVVLKTPSFPLSLLQLRLRPSLLLQTSAITFRVLL